MPEIFDAQIIKGLKRVALWAWLSALAFGLASGIAKLLGYETVGYWLFVPVWAAVAVFVVAWAGMSISSLVLFAHAARGEDDT